MNLDRALRRANTVTGEKAAARLYADIEAELAMGEPTTEQEHAGEAALRVLEERHLGIQRRSRALVEDGHVPNLSRKGWRAVHTDGQPQPARSPVPARRRPGPRAAPSSRHRNAGRPGRQWSRARVNLVAAIKLGRIIRRRLRRAPARGRARRRGARVRLITIALLLIVLAVAYWYVSAPALVLAAGLWHRRRLLSLLVRSTGTRS